MIHQAFVYDTNFLHLNNNHEKSHHCLCIYAIGQPAMAQEKYPQITWEH